MAVDIESAFRMAVGDPSAVAQSIASRKATRDRNNSERLSVMRGALMSAAIGDASAVSIMAEMENRADIAANTLSQEAAAPAKNLNPVASGSSDFEQPVQHDMSF